MRKECNLDFIKLAMYYFSLCNGNFYDAYYFAFDISFQNSSSTYQGNYLKFHQLPFLANSKPLQKYEINCSDFSFSSLNSVFSSPPLSGLLFGNDINVYPLLRLLVYQFSKQNTFEASKDSSSLFCRPKFYDNLNFRLISSESLSIYRNSLLKFKNSYSIYSLEIINFYPDYIYKLLILSSELGLLLDTLEWISKLSSVDRVEFVPQKAFNRFNTWCVKKNRNKELNILKSWYENLEKSSKIPHACQEERAVKQL